MPNVKPILGTLMPRSGECHFRGHQVENPCCYIRFQTGINRLRKKCSIFPIRNIVTALFTYLGPFGYFERQ